MGFRLSSNIHVALPIAGFKDLAVKCCQEKLSELNQLLFFTSQVKVEQHKGAKSFPNDETSQHQ